MKNFTRFVDAVAALLTDGFEIQTNRGTSMTFLRGEEQLNLVRPYGKRDITVEYWPTPKSQPQVEELGFQGGRVVLPASDGQ